MYVFDNDNFIKATNNKSKSRRIIHHSCLSPLSYVVDAVDDGADDVCAVLVDTVHERLQPAHVALAVAAGREEVGIKLGVFGIKR